MNASWATKLSWHRTAKMPTMTRRPTRRWFWRSRNCKHSNRPKAIVINLVVICGCMVTSLWSWVVAKAETDAAPVGLWVVLGAGRPKKGRRVISLVRIVCVFMVTSLWSWVVATVESRAARRVVVVRTFGFAWFRKPILFHRKRILFLWFLRRAELDRFCSRVHRPPASAGHCGLASTIELRNQNRWPAAFRSASVKSMVRNGPRTIGLRQTGCFCFATAFMAAVMATVGSGLPAVAPRDVSFSVRPLCFARASTSFKNGPQVVALLSTRCDFMVTSFWSWVMAAIDFESEEQLHRVVAPHRKRFLRPVSSNALPKRVFLLKLGPIRPAQNSFIPLFPSQLGCSNRARRRQQQHDRLRVELRL